MNNIIYRDQSNLLLQFFIILEDEPLYNSEYTPIGKVLYWLNVLEKIKYLRNYEYILRPDFINSFRLLVN